MLAMLTILFVAKPIDVQAFSSQIIQKGAYGDDVIELQARLQNIGFYRGKIDGTFGWGTYWALRNFQDKFGLPIDGLAGTSTKKKLVAASNFNKKFVHEQIEKGNTFTYYGNVPIEKQVIPKKQTTSNKSNKKSNVKKKTTKSENKSAKSNNKSAKSKNKSAKSNNKATKKSNSRPANAPAGLSENDITLLSQAVYGEARGEPYEGQVAVAAVILNRLESPSFPNTISGVIFEPLAFTAVADGQIWLEPNETARKAVMDAINGMDPSENATYYFNPDTATSKWIWSRPQIKKIGKHIFCE